MTSDFRCDQTQSGGERNVDLARSRSDLQVLESRRVSRRVSHPTIFAILAVLVLSPIFCGCARLDGERKSPFLKLPITTRNLFQRPDQSESQKTSQTAVPSEGSTNTDDPTSDATRMLKDIEGQQASTDPFATTSNGVSNISFRDEQQAYELGRQDAMQAAYQQPMGNTYSNPVAPRPAGAAQYYPPAYDPAQRPTMPQPSPEIQHNEQAYPPPSVSEQIQRDFDDQRSREQRVGPPGPNGPIMHSNPAPAHMSSPPVATPQYAPQTNSQPPRNYSSRNGSGHFSDGMNLVGTELRHHVKTATEIAFEFRDENDRLRQQIASCGQRNEQLSKKIQTQQATLTNTQELLTKSNRKATLLQEKIASQNVRLQDLAQEKLAIEANADKALKEIESTLDEMLIESISKTK